MKRNRVTQKEVALRAGVSFMSVSRVVNQSLTVRPETRFRVEEAIRELDYRPNRVAQALNRGRCPAVGVLLPAREAWIPRELLEGIESEARLLGWEPERIGPPALGERLEGRDGLDLQGLILVLPEGAVIQRLLKSGDLAVPHLAVGRDVGLGGVPWVAGRMADAARAAIGLLRAAGHVRAALVGGADGGPGEGPDGRVSALAKAAWDEGLAVHRVAPGENPRWATAYICLGNTAARALIDQRESLGQRCPEDFSVLVFGTDGPGQGGDGWVSGFQEPWELLGREAVRRLGLALAGEGTVDQGELLPWFLAGGRSIGPRPSGPQF
jgi:DNA-binding LacI/PurR family transcriptional regulator